MKRYNKLYELRAELSQSRSRLWLSSARLRLNKSDTKKIAPLAREIEKNIESLIIQLEDMIRSTP